MQYINFDIKVESLENNLHPIAATSSVAGEASEKVAFPFDAAQLTAHLDTLGNILLRERLGRTFELDEEEADGAESAETNVETFSHELYKFLMHGSIGRRFAVHRELCRQQGKGVRIRLKIESPKLATLPWEFMRDDLDSYLALSQHTPIVRYIDLPRVLVPLAVQPPLRMLGMIANPSNLPTLNVEEEKRQIEEATIDLRERGMLELEWLDGQDWRALQRALRRNTWHLFHFIGHGNFDERNDEGYLAFADRNGRAQRMSATNLARLLGDHASLRVALLNACEGGQGGHDVFSSTAATLIQQGVPAVVGMQYAISDTAAIEFARTFYESLADGLSAESAISEARKSMSFASDSLEWGTPALFTHAPDGVLFDLGGNSAETQPTPTTPPPAIETSQPALTKPQSGTWQRSDAREFSNALLGAYTYNSLKLAIRFQLGHQLDQIVAPSNFQNVIFDLIQLAEREGWILDLVKAAYEENQGNQALAVFAKRVLD